MEGILYGGYWFWGRELGGENTVSVSIENITKIFQRGVVALDNVSMEIEDKEFLVILGPSGSGKTTLLRIIAGLEKPTKGRIKIGDNIVVDASRNIFIPPQKRDIAMVFQNWALYPNMKVFDNIAFPLQIKGLNKEEIRKRVRYVAEILGIDQLLDRYPRQLSGGQQQRVALARALVKEPKVLLLDEPFSNLDARVRITARSFVKKIQREIGITTILVTHDQADAFAVGDKIAVLNQGKVIQFGKPSELYESPANIFVADFVGEPPTSLIKIPVINGMIRYLNIQLNSYTNSEVIIGIRPDDAIVSAESAGEGKLFIAGTVEGYEYIGSREYVLVNIGEGVSFRALSPIPREYIVGEKVYVTLKRIHIFDVKTGTRLLSIP
ncbi:MAG TPA: ABC transporter ATP-binding protein [Sulfolobales archaeon]|nr:ABC transporter ATP-binding protein [Sulfolobales archaeon]